MRVVVFRRDAFSREESFRGASSAEIGVLTFVRLRAPSGNYSAGNQLGPYSIQSLLGRGGMGAVYRAIDASGQEIALKVLPREVTEDQRFVLRFKHEAETAAR